MSERGDNHCDRNDDESMLRYHGDENGVRDPLWKPSKILLEFSKIYEGKAAGV